MTSDHSVLLTWRAQLLASLMLAGEQAPWTVEPHTAAFCANRLLWSRVPCRCVPEHPGECEFWPSQTVHDVHSYLLELAGMKAHPVWGARLRLLVERVKEARAFPAERAEQHVLEGVSWPCGRSAGPSFDEGWPQLEENT